MNVIYKIFTNNQAGRPALKSKNMKNFDREHAESRTIDDVRLCNDCENEISTGKYCEACAKSRNLCICGNGFVQNETDIILSETGNIYLNCKCENCQNEYLLISSVLSVEKQGNKLIVNNNYDNELSYFDFVLKFEAKKTASNEEKRQLKIAKGLIIDILRTKYMDLFHEKYPESDSLLIEERVETVRVYGNLNNDFSELINKKLFQLMFGSEIQKLPIYVDLNVKKYISLT